MSDRGHIVHLASMGWVVRNYLIGDFLPAVVAENDLTVVSPLGANAAFRAALAARGARLETLLPPPSTWWLRRAQSRRQLYHFCWCGTASMRIKLQRVAKWHGGLHNLRNGLSIAVARTLTRLTGDRCVRGYDKAAHACSLRTEAARHYRELFLRLRPTMVFSPAPLDPREWVPVHVAREMGIPTAVAILSWDNLSTKSRLVIDFDHYFVWSEKMRGELMRFYPRVRPEQVSTCGTPQFDFYFNPALRPSREDFCRGKGLDPARPILVYGGVTPGLMPREPVVVARLIEDIRAGRIAGRPQLLVRLHPKDDGSRYAGFAAQYPEVRVDMPGRANRGDLASWSPSLDDMSELVGTVLHGSVHLNVASTLAIDAAVLDRPVVNIRYDLQAAGEPASPGMAIYDYSHYRPIVDSGGVRVVESPADLVAAINAYLADPALDRAGRRRIVETECGLVDGRAGRRIAARLNELNCLMTGNHRNSPATGSLPASS